MMVWGFGKGFYCLGIIAVKLGFEGGWVSGERNEGRCFDSICRNRGFVIHVPNFTSLVGCLLIWRERKRKMRKYPIFRMRSMYGTQYIVTGFEKLRTFI